MPEKSKSASSFGKRHPAADRADHIELRRRPLRRPVATPSGDSDDKAAHTRRGRGVPPPCGKEWEYHPSKHFVQGKSFAASLHLFTAQSRSGPEMSANRPPRPAVRLSDRAYTSHLAGGAASVVTPTHDYRPLRRPATAAPPVTTRVLGVAVDDAEPPKPMYAYLGTRGRQDVLVTTRPTTAPSMLAGKTSTGMRSGYEASRSAHDDVVKYRHSGGICPREYKLTAERASAPQLVVPARDQARNNFNDNRASYSINKMRGRLSDIW